MSMTKPTKEQIELLEKWRDKFDVFILSNDECRFVLPKMEAKLGEVAISDMLNAIKEHFEETLKTNTAVTEERVRREEKGYIAELEKAVAFLAHVYQSNFEHLHQAPLQAISVDNPDKREMTPEEEYGLMNFSTVQGLKSRIEVEKLASFWKNQPINLQLIIKRLEDQILSNNQD